MNTAFLFQMGQLSEASYADLASVLTAANSTDELIAKLRLKDFSRTQAEDLAALWSVIYHQPNTTNGFSGTLFQSTSDANTYVYALRGTEPFTYGDLSADVGDIVTDGIAIKQIIDLYNDVTRMRTATGAVYNAAVLDLLGAETARLALERFAFPLPGIKGPYETALLARNDIIIDNPTGLVYTIKLEPSSGVFFDERALGTGALPDTAQLTVSGHSLGGHLAVAFNRLFPEYNSDAYTINGAGYATGSTPGVGGAAQTDIRNLFTMLGGDASFDASRIQNLYGAAGINVTTMNSQYGLVQQGPTDEIYTESASFSTALGHSSSQMVDSLAVYDLFLRIVPGVTNQPVSVATILLNPLFQSITSEVNNPATLERMVAVFNELFVAPGTGVTVAANNIDNRQWLYQTIHNIRISPLYQGLEFARTGSGATLFNLNQVDAGLLATTAQNDIAYRYALDRLVPFVIEGQPAIYTNQNINGNLDRYDPATHSGTMTDAYLQDRAQFLFELLRANSGSQAYQSDTHYLDIESHSALSPGFVAGNNTDLPDQVQILFGGNNNDALNGGVRADHLYGGAGSDVLRGTRFNVDDNQSDYLEGGDGDDTYVVGGGDVILDTDGIGRVIFNGQALFGGDQSNGTGPYLSDDGRFSYVQDDTGLHVTDTQENETIVIQGFRNDEVGIHLGVEQPAVPSVIPVTTTEITGDFQWHDLGQGGWTLDAHPQLHVQLDSLGNPVVDLNAPDPTWADQLLGSTGNDVIRSGGGNDQVDGLAGNDWILGGEGNDTLMGHNGDDVIDGEVGDDLIIGEYGKDWLRGGDGNDVIDGSTVRAQFWIGVNLQDNDRIEGGTGTDALFGDAGDDQLYAGDYVVVTDAMAQDTGQVSNERDWLGGGIGDDTLVGSNGQNLLSGGEGKDLIFGNGGDDFIFGDTHADAVSYVDSILPSLAQWSVNRDAATHQYVFGPEVRFTETTTGGDVDLIYAGSGNDVVWAGSGADIVYAGIGNDTLYGQQGNDFLLGEDGDDTLFGDETSVPTEQGNDYLDGGVGADTLLGGGGGDVLEGGEGDDTIFGDSQIAAQNHGNDVIGGGAGDDYLEGNGGSDSVSGGSGSDTLYGDNHVDDESFDGDDFLEGGDGNDDLIGNGGNDTLFGDAGDDQMLGDDYSTPAAYVGSDYLDGGAGNDLLVGGGGADTLIGGDGNDELQGNDDSVSDILIGGAGADRFFAGDNDVIMDAEVNDVISVNGANVIINIANLNVQDIRVVAGVNASGQQVLQMITASGNRVSFFGITGDSGQVFNFANGSLNQQTLMQRADAVTLVGTTGNDVLYGSNYNDTLVGGIGNDVLQGQGGNDTYVFNLGDGSDVILEQTGTADINTLNFGAGISTAALSLGLGSLLINTNDGLGDEVHLGNFDPTNVYGERAIDVFNFADGTSLTYEQLVSRGFDVNGTNGDDIVNGTNVTDRITGGIGNDILTGGEGDDSYYYNLGDNQDVIIDSAGNDALVFGSGIALADILVSQTGNDLVLGMPQQGSITLQNWYTGNLIETFRFSDGSVVDAATMQARSIPGQVNHAPVLQMAVPDQQASEDAAFSFTLPADTFTDTDAGDALTYTATLQNGVALPNWLQFNTQSQTFTGTPGNADVGVVNVVVTATDNSGTSVSDSFTLNVNNSNDAPVVATTLANQITNEEALFTYTIPANTFADVDNIHGDTLTLTATLSDGTALPTWLGFDAVTQTFSGTPANGDVGSVNILVTATDVAGVSVSTGLALTINNVNDAPIANGVIGDQTVLEDQAFNLVVAADLFSDVDVIHGDTLIYGATLTDGSALPSWLNFDATTRTFSGTPANGDVGVMPVVLTVTDTAGASVSQNFQINVANTNDAPTLATALADASATEGSAFSYTVAADTFTDVDAGDTLSYIATLADGTALPGWLSFNAATRTFSGNPVDGDAGAYNVRLTATDQLGASALDDFTINVTASIAHVINGNASNNILQGTAFRDVINGLGGNDTLYGYAGDDTLDGDSGSDVMYGGTGNDTYIVNSIFDRVAENANEGNDTVQSSVPYALGANVENLMLTGNSASIAIGNALDNVLLGNAASNALYGGAGNDRLDGGASSDLLIGGNDNDTYLFGRGGGNDSIIENDSTAGNTDTVSFNVNPLDLVLQQSGSNLLMSLHGGLDSMTVQNWYSGTQYQTEVIRATDGSTLANSQVAQLIQAMASFSASHGGISWDQAIDQNATEVQSVLTAYWQPSV